MERDCRINNFKALLVLGMILAHSLLLLSKQTGAAGFFSEVINLITFSGFFFSFGYVYNTSYSGRRIPLAKKVRSSGSALIGYYISAFAWIALCGDGFGPGHPAVSGTLAVILLLNVAPYSEFLLSFFLIGVLYWIVRPHLDNAKKTWLLPFLTFASLCFPLIPFWRFYPQVFIHHHLTLCDFYAGLFLGSRAHTYFPVFSYLFFFLLGIWFSERKTGFSPIILAIAAAGSGLYLAFRIRTGSIPERFPPGLMWVTGSWLILYAYYLIAAKIPANRFLSLTGENTLGFLLLSNIMIFALRGKTSVSPALALLTGVALIAVIYFIISRTRPAFG